MPYRGHHGWSRLHYYIIMTVSQTFLCRNFTFTAVLVAACPIHPSTGNYRGTPAVGKVVLYIWGSLSGGGVSHCLLPPNSRPFFVCQCTAINTTDIYSPHYKKCTLTLCISWDVNSSTVIHCLYVVSNWVPGSRQERQTIPAVFLIIFCIPTLSNSPFRVLNAPCSQSGSVDINRPSSALKRRHGVAPTFQTRPDLPLSLTPTRRSVVPMRPLPY